MSAYLSIGIKNFFNLYTLNGALVGAGHVYPAEDDCDEGCHVQLLEDPGPVNVDVPQGVDPGPLKNGRKFGHEVRVENFFVLFRPKNFFEV